MLTGQLAGRLCDSRTGDWRTDLSVSITVADTKQTTTTDDYGFFVFEAVPVGNYLVQFDNTSGFSHLEWAEVSADENYGCP